MAKHGIAVVLSPVDAGISAALHLSAFHENLVPRNLYVYSTCHRGEQKWL